MKPWWLYFREEELPEIANQLLAVAKAADAGTGAAWIRVENAIKALDDAYPDWREWTKGQ